MSFRGSNTAEDAIEIEVDRGARVADHIEPSVVPLNDLSRRLIPLRGELTAALQEVLTSGWFVLGRKTSQFEEQWASFCGVTQAVGVASGTDALELGLKGVGVGPGSTVVTVANAGMYSTTAILACGARPLYVDVDPSDSLVDLSALEAVLAGNDVHALVVTHLYGRMVNMPRVRDITDKFGIRIVEDCAQAHGAALDGRRAGSFGDAAAFSFYPTKNLGALGDGGAVVTSDVHVAKALRSLRQYGWSERYVSERSGGRNSRLDEMQAAALTVMLPHLVRWNDERRSAAKQLTDRIHHPLVKLPTPRESDDVHHLFIIRAERRDGLREHLRDRGVGSDVHYPVPDHQQPGIAQLVAPQPTLAGTEEATSKILTLPCFPGIEQAELDRVVEAVNSWPAR